MASDSAQFPAKSRLGNAKVAREPPAARIPPKSRIVPPSGKRVFGTTQHPNIAIKVAPEKLPKEKPTFRVPKKTAKETETRPPQHGTAALEAKKEKTTTKRMVRSVCFQQKLPQGAGKCSSLEESVELRTPAKVAVKARSGAVTPYRTAEKCSKCRFDKLETSSHWLGQIRLAEVVGKHFVSYALFGLALDCKAEPMRNMLVELKKYVARHDYLNQEEEWKNLLQSYGLMKGGMNGDVGKQLHDSGEKKRTAEDDDGNLNTSCHGCCAKESETTQGVQLFKESF